MQNEGIKMIIDGHQHVLKNVDEQIRINKDCNIDKVVLFSTVVHPETANNKTEFVEEMSRLNKILSGRLNPTDERLKAIDELVRAVGTAPDYFVGFGPCPFGLDANTTADWIENNILGNNLNGIGEIAFAPGMVSSIENMLACVHEHKKRLPVWIHTFNPLTLPDLKEIVRYARKYQNTRIIFGHAGGSHWLELIDLVQDLANIYVDLSASFTIFSIKYIAEILPERCVFSSDLPYGDPLLGIRQIEHLIKDRHIRDNILGNNTETLLNY